MIKDSMAWELYESVKEQHSLTGMFDMADRCHAFYSGDQWRGCETGDEKMPVLNIIKPIVDHKVATVAQNKLTITLNPLNYGTDYESAIRICDKLTSHMANMWEQNKMDRYLWVAAKEAAITGDSYVFFYDGKGDAQILDKTCVYLSDEQNSSVQEQKFIIIRERKFVEDVKEEARKNGIAENEIIGITGDSDTKEELGDEADKEVKSALSEKLTCVLMLWKDEKGTVHICRACKNCVYSPDRAIEGLTLYPIASLLWSEKKGSARGLGVVEPLISNQIEINKQNARMIMAAKRYSFPHIAYRTGSVLNPAQLENVGSTIEVDDVSVQRLSDMVTYLQPAPMSGDVFNLWQNLYQLTKDLAGGSDAALGQIDPSTASGTAIIAVKSQAALPLNDQMSAFKQFVEDIAAIWWDLWMVYNPNGMEIIVDENVEIVPNETLKALKISTRIDVSPDSPFDRFAQEQSVERAFAGGHISFEEYVEALDGNSTAPKNKFEGILARRRSQQEEQAMMMSQMQGAPGGMPQGAENNQNTAALAAAMQGGNV